MNIKGIILPIGPLEYIRNSDLFLTVNSARRLDAYRYQTMAQAVGDDANEKGEKGDASGKGDKQGIRKGKRVTVPFHSEYTLV